MEGEQGAKRSPAACNSCKNTRKNDLFHNLSHSTNEYDILTVVEDSIMMRKK